MRIKTALMVIGLLAMVPSAQAKVWIAHPTVLLPWCYERLGGIRPLEAGFKKIEVKPDFSLPILNKVEVSHLSPYGILKSWWERKGDGLLDWEVVIPANTSAVLVMPDGRQKKVLSGTYRFSLADKKK